MKLNTKHVIYASLAFGWITIFWFGYDQLIQTINIQTFSLKPTVSGFILAIDNILGLFLLPLFGYLSDKTHTKYGRRMPYIVAGTCVSLTAFLLVAVFANKQNLPLYIISLCISLIAMAAYRSPALSLVPDITPEPLRSKANAISNIVSALFNVVAIALVSPFLTKSNIAENNYYPVVIGIIVSSLITMAIFLKKVNENKYIEDFRRETEEFENSSTKPADQSLPEASDSALSEELCEGAETSEVAADTAVDEAPAISQDAVADGNADEAVITPATKTKNSSVLKDKIFILLAVFFFYMAYNALVSNLNNYATFVLKVEAITVPMIVTMAGAVLGFVPATKFATAFGRKKSIIAGFIVMSAAFAVVSLNSLTVIMSGMPEALYLTVTYMCFAVAGFGYGFVMVNIYPLFLEYSDQNTVGSGTGIFASSMTVAMVITPILSSAIVEIFGKLWNVEYVTAQGETMFGDFRMLVPYCAVNLILALVAALLIKEKNRTGKVGVKRGIEMFDTDI